MQILSHSQIFTAVEKGKIIIDGVSYILPDILKKYVSKHMPSSGSCTIGKEAILVAMSSHRFRGGEIVMFLPNGPPDPGIVSNA